MCGCGKGGVTSAVAGFVVIAATVAASHSHDAPGAVTPITAPHAAVQRVVDISGDWEGTVSGEDFPEDVPLLVTLILDDDGGVTGTFEIPDGKAPFKGAFDAETNTLTGSVTPDDGSNWEMELTLDGDELSGDATETNSGVEAEIELERLDD